MKQLIHKAKLALCRWLWRFLKSDLPTGVNDFEKFSHSVLETYGIPDLPSYHHAIASMVMHLGPQTTSVKKYWIACSIRKAQANQVAFEVIQKIKEEEKKAKDEAANAQPVQVEGV